MLDPRCCQALSSSLQLLNIAYTQTQDLSGSLSDAHEEENNFLGLELMSRLYSLDASGNLLSSLPQVGGRRCNVNVGWHLTFSGCFPCLASLHACLYRPKREQTASEAANVSDTGDCGRSWFTACRRTSSGCYHQVWQLKRISLVFFLTRVLATQMAKGKAKVRRHWPDFCAKLTTAIRSVFS